MGAFQTRAYNTAAVPRTAAAAAPAELYSIHHGCSVSNASCDCGSLSAALTCESNTRGSAATCQALTIRGSGGCQVDISTGVRSPLSTNKKHHFAHET